MWTKIKAIITTIMGTVVVLISLLAIAAFGVAVMFVGWFLLWGILGIIVAIIIGAIIYDAVRHAAS